ncbi:hypothetical protein [Microbulbifer sp. SAOS-129_SWC]|uniref:hypothetical protein n=1 Tax=Microbulbifer sp. SAOS-129_SWC TaxID=3145235 RepID=UPI003217C94C
MARTATTATMVANLELRSEQYKRQLAQAQARNKAFAREVKTASTASDDFSRSMRTASTSTGKFVGTLGRLSPAIVSVAGPAGLGVLAASSIAAEREMGNLSRAFGVSVQAMKEWQYAGNVVGVQGDKVADIMKDASEKIGEFARTGGGEAADLFKQLNLDISEFVGLAPDQQLLKIGEALQQVGTRSEKIFFLESMASDASLLLPLLDNNATKLRELQQEARDAGVALNSTDSAKLQQAGDAMFRMEQASRGLSNQLAVVLAPSIESVSNRVIALSKQGETLATGMEVTFTAVGAVMAGRFAAAIGGRIAQMGLLQAATYKATVQTNAMGQAIGRTTLATRTAAVAATGLRTAFSFLGGPVGVITIALTSLVAWNAAQPTTEEKAETLRAKINKLAQSWERLSSAQRATAQNEINAKIRDYESDVERLEKRIKKLTTSGSDGGFGVRLAKDKHSPEVEAIQAQIDGLNTSIAEAKSGLTNLGKPNKEGLQAQAKAEFQAALAREQAERDRAATELKNVQETSAAKLVQLDQFLADKNGKLKLDHEQRLQQIAALQIAEQELTKRGYSTMDQLRADYSARENNRYQQALAQLQAQNNSKGGEGGDDNNGGVGPDGLTDAERQRVTSRLETLKLSWLTEQEQLQVQQDEEMSLLDQAYASKLIARDEYERDLTQLEAKHVKQRQALQQAGTKSELGLYVSGAAQILGAAATHSKKMAKLSKEVAIFETGISLVKNIARASEIGYPQNIPMIAGAIAQGVQIAGMMSDLKAPSGVSGGGTAASLPSTTGATAATIDNVASNDEAQKATQPGVVFNLNVQGSIHADNGQAVAEQIKTLISEQDFELIDKNSRQALNLAS